VFVAGAHGRIGSRAVTLLVGRGHVVRALVRTDAQAAALRTGAPSLWSPTPHLVENDDPAPGIP
jgi:uncharacterized protein YbjT (DUF2867 family)